MQFVAIAWHLGVSDCEIPPRRRLECVHDNNLEVRRAGCDDNTVAYGHFRLHLEPCNTCAVGCSSGMVYRGAAGVVSDCLLLSSPRRKRPICLVSSSRQALL